MKFHTIILSSLLILGLASCTQDKNAEEVNIYTHRHYEIDKTLYHQFEETTGIQVNVLKASADELIERVKREGENSPADLIFTVDAGRLTRAKAAGIFQPLNLAEINTPVPSHFVDTDSLWMALTYRTRTAVTLKAGKMEAINLMDLNQAQYSGKILTRSSSNMYNQSMVAELIHLVGKDSAQAWVNGFVANFARKSKGNDRDQVKAMVQGRGEVAVVNAYYIGKMLNSKDSLELAAGNAVQVKYGNHPTFGTHINISGVGLAQYAPNSANAYALINFMLSKNVQKQFAEANYEYPVIDGITLSSPLSDWGIPENIVRNFNAFGELNAEAVEIMENAGWK
ncbi:MAG: iron(III) transport system substrate-binding protein [Sphingobacteriales bacterium]|jgi:iron(III) transport system substrate-binding protein